MLLLTSTSDLLRVVTDATADIEVHASWMDNAAGVITPGRTNTASITTATTTTVVAAPAASTQRNVKHLNITNNHASTSCTVSIEHTDGTNVVELVGVTLLAGENLTLDAVGHWTHYDVNAGEYPAAGARATQAEMEAGTANDKSVTPQGMNWHPGVNKCWVKCGITANVLASWNVTSLTDNGTGDVTVTIATDFSSVEYCAIVSVEMTATTYAVANARTPHIRFGGQAVGTLRCDCIDGTTTTQLVKDPTFWHIAMLGDQ